MPTPTGRITYQTSLSKYCSGMIPTIQTTIPDLIREADHHVLILS